MELQLHTSYDSPMPSGTALDPAHLSSNSTGVTSAFQRWTTYICPECGYDCDSPYEFSDGN
jgi:hypothetical protein